MERIYGISGVYQQDQEYVDYNNLVVASQMRKDCIEIIKSEKVTEEVIKRLGLNMSPKYLGRAIRVETEDNTRFLQVSYTCGNPQEAADVVNTAIDVAADVTKELLKTDVLLLLFEATKPQAETTTNIRKSTWTAAGVGAAAMTALLVIFFLLDDTIRTEDDVQSHQGLSTLAIIPLSNELHVNRGSRNGARGKLQGQKPKWR